MSVKILVSWLAIAKKIVEIAAGKMTSDSSIGIDSILLFT